MFAYKTEAKILRFISTKKNVCSFANLDWRIFRSRVPKDIISNLLIASKCLVPINQRKKKLLHSKCHCLRLSIHLCVNGYCFLLAASQQKSNYDQNIKRLSSKNGTNTWWWHQTASMLYVFIATSPQYSLTNSNIGNNKNQLRPKTHMNRRNFFF